MKKDIGLTNKLTDNQTNRWTTQKLYLTTFGGDKKDKLLVISVVHNVSDPIKDPKCYLLYQ